MGATGYTETPCFGVGRRHVDADVITPQAQTRLEIILPFETCEHVVEYLRMNIMPLNHVTVCIETVEVARITSFVSTAEIGMMQKSGHY